MKTKTTLLRWLAMAAGLCAVSYNLHAAAQATFTDSWKATAAPDTVVYASTASSFSFKASLAGVAGELTTGQLDTNSTLTISIDGNTIFFDTLGDAEKLKLGTSGSANLAYEGWVVSWTPNTLTVTGSAPFDYLGEESLIASNSDGIAGDNTFSSNATPSVEVTLDASDNNGGTFDFSTNVFGSFKNTETEHATNSGGGTIPLEAGSFTGSGSGISFSDTWKDTAEVGTPEVPSTAGMFTFSATLAVDGALTTSDLDSNSQFSISFNGNPIFSDSLGDAQTLMFGPSGSASFPITLMNPLSANLTTNGSVTVKWTATSITVSGSATADILGEEASLTNYLGIQDSSFTMSVTNDVDVTLDASDNNGGTLDFDTNVIATLKNTQTYVENPSGNYFPLEAGSMTGSGSGISFSDTWKDTAVPAGYQVTNSGSASISISLPLDGLVGITNSDFDIGEVGTNSELLLMIGPSTNPVTIFSGSFAEAKPFTDNKNGGSATFTSATIGKLTVTWTATTITVTASTIVDILGEEQLLATNSDGIPGTEPIGGLYEISLMINDTNGGTYSFNDPYVPVTGKNTETELNNGSGSISPAETGTISGTADFTPPTVTITSPAAGFKVNNQNPMIELEGTAKDTAGVASILYYINGDTTNATEIDQEGLPASSIAWSNSVDFGSFGPGTFVVSVYAIDSYGNQSAPVSRTFQWIQTNYAAVTVSPVNAGKVTGLIKPGQLLDVGNYYSVTATATNKNYIFSQWTDGPGGNVLGNTATLNYYDTDGALTANFLPNPFTNSDLAGTYTGLYFDTVNGVQVRNSGYISVTVTGTGEFSGNLYNADYGIAPFKLSGQLSESPGETNATATLPPIKLGKDAYLQVSLQIATDPVLTDSGAGLLLGTVNSFSDPTETNQNGSAQIQGALSVYTTNILPGLYNLVIAPVSGDPSQGPGGYSYGTATVSGKTGSAEDVALVLNLADGTTPTISFSTAMSQYGSCPIYASLYGGNGVILGWMFFNADGSGTMSPTNVMWLTAYDYTSHTYANGFNATPILSGGLYLPPRPGTNLFGAGVTALTFEIDQGYAGLSLPDKVDDAVTFNPAKNTFTDTSKVTITLTTTTGALSGMFYPAGSKTSLSYKGVEVGGVGYGFYQDTANKETGPIWLGAP